MSLATRLRQISGLSRRTMFTTGAAAAAFAAPNSSVNTHTTTAMGRWSILNKQLPAANRIKTIHVYDFDNTLFKTPLPNPKLWNGPTIGTLSNPDAFVNGGWWHDSRILAATGEGLAKEEPRSWDGWWNEKIVELINLSVEQQDALCVLLTGRSESGFSELIKRMVTSKGLEFDLISLKPAVGPNNQRFPSTMIFKQMFLTALMETYNFAEEIRIYEDRPKHVKGFRDFLADYNKKQSGMQRTRGPITGEVIQVHDMATNLDPVMEVAEVQHLINDHNAALSQRRRGVRGERLKIKKTVFFTGYLIKPTDSQRLLSLVQIPQNIPESELKYHANNIMICPRPCPPHLLEKVGGIGSKMTWEVTGTACFENNIWAACVRPVPASAKFHTDNHSPHVVLALRKGARPVDAGKIPSWHPVPPGKAFTFETEVGEKLLLRIEAEDPREGDHGESQFNRGSKRKHTAGEDDFRARASLPTGPRNEQRHFHQHAGRGGGGPNRGGFRGGNSNRGFRGGGQRGGNAKGGRGGRGAHHYKSLDDMAARENQNQAGSVSYEDSPQSRGFVTQPPTGPAAQFQGQYQNNRQQQQQARPSGGSNGHGEMSNFY